MSSLVTCGGAPSNELICRRATSLLSGPLAGGWQQVVCQESRGRTCVDDDLTTLLIEEPALSKACLRAIITASACVSTFPFTNWPEMGSRGGIPGRNRKPLARTISDSGTPSLRTISDCTGTSTISFSLATLPTSARIQQPCRSNAGALRRMRAITPAMCNLYPQTRNVEAVRQLFRVTSNRAAAVERRDAIFPGHAAPVVRKAEDGERELVELSWGFVLPQPQGKAPRRVINTRDDKMQSSFWRDSVRLRRCLVPASSFCEPNGDVKPATWNWFALNGDDQRPLFAFAGIWRRHQGPIKKDGPSVTLDVFSFMTTTPNALVATVNHERMPVVITRRGSTGAWRRRRWRS